MVTKTPSQGQMLFLGGYKKEKHRHSKTE